MQILKYDGDLEKDIDASKIKFDKTREIIRRIRDFILTIPVYVFVFLCFYGFDKEVIKAQINSLVVGYILLQTGFQIFLYKSNKKYREKKYKESNDRLSHFDVRLYQSIGVNKENLQESIIEEDETKETKEENGVKTTKKRLDKCFYMLNKDDQIKVLKYVKETIKEGKKKKVETSTLYLMEDSEIEEETLPVKLVKKLEWDD